MKCISLWQPWASLWCSSRKVHETRHWPTSHRGWLLVHAAKRRPDDHNDTQLGFILDDEFGHHWGIDLPFGALIGKVDITDCRRTEDIVREYAKDESPKPSGELVPDDYECGDFSPGRYGWKRGEFILFAEPIPYRGQQGMWDVPDHVVREALPA